jgi:hypothetical protein
MQNNNKDKQQQAFEQAYDLWQKKHKRWLIKFDRITEAEPDQSHYDWRLQYFNQFEALSTIFEKLREEYLDTHSKKNVFKRLKDEQIEDPVTESINDVSQFTNDLTRILRRKIFGNQPKQPQMREFKQDGTKKGELDLLRESLKDSRDSQESLAIQEENK